MAMVKSKAKGSRIFNFCNILFFALIMIVCILPVWHVLCASFSNASWVMNQRGLIWYIKDFTLNGYQLVFNDNSIWTGYLNTFIYVIGTTVLGMFLTVMAAYALSRKDFIWANPLMLIISFTMLFSGGIVTLYILVTQTLNMYDSRWALILPNCMSAFYLILVRTAMQNVPDSLEESAMLDGANYFQIFIKIVIPLCVPVLAAVAVFTAVGQWNSWTDNFYLVRDPDLQCLQLILMNYLKQSEAVVKALQQGFSYDEIKNMVQISPMTIRMTVTVVSVVPIFCVYPFMQKYFVKGLLLGAIKG